MDGYSRRYRVVRHVFGRGDDQFWQPAAVGVGDGTAPAQEKRGGRRREDSLDSYNLRFY